MYRYTVMLNNNYFKTKNQSKILEIRYHLQFNTITIMNALNILNTIGVIGRRIFAQTTRK